MFSLFGTSDPLITSTIYCRERFGVTRFVSVASWDVSALTPDVSIAYSYHSLTNSHYTIPLCSTLDVSCACFAVSHATVFVFVQIGDVSSTSWRQYTFQDAVLTNHRKENSFLGTSRVGQVSVTVAKDYNHDTFTWRGTDFFYKISTVSDDRYTAADNEGTVVISMLTVYRVKC